MRKGVFVTGTDTNVGKTVTSALIVSALRQAGLDAGYFKPVQTGPDSDTVEVHRLAGGGWISSTPLYAFPEPISPHRAAALNDARIDLGRIESAWRELPEARWVVEGAGGLLVPLNDESRIAELAGRLGLPLIVVSSTRLGTINHTLLTLEAARRRELEVRGVVLAGEPDPGLQDTISRFGGVPILAEIPRFPELSPALVAREASRIFCRGTLDRIFGEAE